MAERDTRFGGNLELANRSAGIASLAKSESDWQRANQEFRSFHTRTDPTAPEAIRDFGSPKRAGQFNWQVPSADYYQNMRESNQILMDYRKNQMRDMILGPDKIYPPELKYNAGITNQNLDGYKVWNAGGVGDWLGEKTFPFVHKYFGNPLNKFLGFDETPLEFADPYAEEPPPVDGGELLPGWELHQDGFHYFPPFEGDDQDLMDQFMEDVGPEDLGVEPQLEANLSQTWQTIVDKTGNEELANQWLESQQANRGGIIGLI